MGVKEYIRDKKMAFNRYKMERQEDRVLKADLKMKAMKLERAVAQAEHDVRQEKMAIKKLKADKYAGAKSTLKKGVTMLGKAIDKSSAPGTQYVSKITPDQRINKHEHLKVKRVM